IMGPLAQGASVSNQCLAALDSSRMVLAWRSTSGSQSSIYFRVFGGSAWGNIQGPAGAPTGSAWPFTLAADPVSERLSFLWESDAIQGGYVSYRDVSLGGPWDAASHVLAGPDSGGAYQPLAVQDAAGDLVVVWVQTGAVHVRLRQGTAPVGQPPQIIPLDPAPQYLGRNYPNPMRPRTTIPFRVPATGARGSAGSAAGAPPTPDPARRVRLSILDVSGRRVRLLLDGPRDPGDYQVTWDGTLEGGRRAPAGVYFCRLELGAGRVETRKLLLLP
ncbi:MAG TPA: FlgD immunoglobulin-like domain containing protein, partial [Candidatus Saccharimonadales bacterium]|nr:FlgD immunoglobulin-like domain containing protein [Candidatus Saccharimonadales bacterium]